MHIMHNAHAAAGIYAGRKTASSGEYNSSLYLLYSAQMNTNVIKRDIAAKNNPDSAA